MPSYFFHLKLELYSTPVDSKRSKLFRGQLGNTYIPRPGTDIFKTALPAHRKGHWTSRKPTARPYANSIDTPTIDAATSGCQRSRSTHQRISPPSGILESHGNALLLPERSLRLRKETPSSPRLSSTTKHSHKAAAEDWRYDAVEIESIDMEISKVKGTTSNGLHTKAVYVPSDPIATEVGYGVVHLYRDSEESAILDEDALPRKSLERTSKDDGRDTFNPDDCTTLCIVAVPSWMSPADLLGFVGDQAREDVSHFRLIRTSQANKYMVLLKFRSAKKARDWQKLYNGRTFNDATPESCHVVHIKSVEFLTPDAGADSGTGTKFPRNMNDPFTAVANTTNVASKNLLSRPLAPPPPNLLELPTCPVCLERMDETTGLLTILCQHVFHCACLEKWQGSGCPVCRYTHSPSYTFPYPRPRDGAELDQEETEPLCSVCAGTNNLWICLICGNIGCGRYDGAHAYDHYESTSHCYAMDINTQHVWDYAGDGYVHRLIQSKPVAESSGRSMIDMPMRQRHENEAFRAEGSDSVPREKMENMASEYTYLLTSQLEGQRRYFEEQVERAVDKASQASARAEEAAHSAIKAQAQLEDARADRQAMSENLSRVEKALEKADKARAKFEQMARDMSSQLREEKTMNEGLLKRVKAVEEAAEKANKEKEKAIEEKRELEEMNHDLTMFISSQEKVKELQAAGEEVVDGSVSVPEPPAAKKGKGKGRKK